MQRNAQSIIRKVIDAQEDIPSFQKHLKEVIEGTDFKGSHRSGQFLTYIVEASIAGHFDALKERMIGIELFGRAPSYDTGEDAIVRVTASDVRKRLLQHYGRDGAASEWRISLPLGSYVPEISRNPQNAAPVRSPVVVPQTPAGTSPAAPQLGAIPQVPAAVVQLAAHVEAPQAPTRGRAGWRTFAVVLVALNLAIWGAFWLHFSRAASASVSVLPWSAFFRSQRPMLLVTSDPNIAEIQGLTGGTVTLSDYANQQYIPNVGSLSPEIISFCKEILRGDKAAAVDARVVADIAELAQTASAKINVQVARDVRLADLYRDENFILLGSPRSNPWDSLFDDQLDFRFTYDRGSRQEIIRNVHPRPGEASSYVPTAGGWATGQSFATVSFVQNTNRNGQVLLLAGADGEGTQAAGDLVTNPQRLSLAMRKCGIASSKPVKYFQLLLRLNTMAGSPSNIDVLACHILPGNSAR